MATLLSIVRSLKRPPFLMGRNDQLQRLSLHIEALRDWLEEQPERDKQSLAKLADRGWFLDPNMPVANIGLLARAIEEYPNDVDTAYSGFIRNRLDEIEWELVAAYPSRNHLLRDAFEAHRKAQYTLSVPVFLTQADGIFRERFNKELYDSKRQGVSRAITDNTYRSSCQDRFFRAVLEPFKVPSPLWNSQGELDKAFTGLNRHQVLHGMSTDYDVELNSLRAVSLLSNLRWVLNRSVGNEETPEIG